MINILYLLWVFIYIYVFLCISVNLFAKKKNINKQPQGQIQITPHIRHTQNLFILTIVTIILPVFCFRYKFQSLQNTQTIKIMASTSSESILHQSPTITPTAPPVEDLQQPSTSTNSSNRSTNINNNDDDDKTDDKKDDSIYECNICLDTAKDAVVSMCGHLFCWPCLHQWLETRPNRQLCPVCKAAISKEKVIPLYGRGSNNQEDPR